MRDKTPAASNSSRVCHVSVLVVLAACVTAARATTFTVGAGKNFATPEEIKWSSIHPGDVVLIESGTYPSLLGTGNSMLLNGVGGTAAKPITVEAASSSQPPVLDAGILITGGTRYVNISNLDVSRSKSQAYAAVVVDGNSANVVLSGLKVHDSFVGVEFLAAGLTNTLEKSQIYSNVQQGVTGAPPGTGVVPSTGLRTSVSGNTIHDNGSHGIEITGPDYAVEHNHITHNGGSVHGTSGIHVFSATDVAGADGCNDNLIAYNYVTTQQDLDGTDGNGIQIDDFCNANTVEFNVVWANAGAGISVLSAAGNVIVANTSYSNATDKGRAAKLAGVFRGEIILGSMADLCANPYGTRSACNVKSGASSGNVVYDNIVVSSQADVPGIMVSSDAVTRNTNDLYPNLYRNLASSTTGVLLSWDQEPYYNAGTIDSVTGQSKRGGGNLDEMPAFVNVAAPGSDGLNLSARPENVGWAITPATPDILGVLPGPAVAYYGAYYK